MASRRSEAREEGWEEYDERKRTGKKENIIKYTVMKKKDEHCDKKNSAK